MSSVRPSTISDDFSETIGPIVIKFYVQPPGSLGTKCCSTGLGHMTQDGKNVKTLKNLVLQNQ